MTKDEPTLPELPPGYRWRLRYTAHGDSSLKRYFMEIVKGRLFPRVVEWGAIVDFDHEYEGRARNATYSADQVEVWNTLRAAEYAFANFTSSRRGKLRAAKITGYYPPNRVADLDKQEGTQ